METEGTSPSAPVYHRYTPSQRVGERGAAKAARIQEALAALLETTAWSRITVMEVGRMAGTSAATVYTYYADLEAILRATVASFERRSEPLPTHMAMVWALLNFETASGLR